MRWFSRDLPLNEGKKLYRKLMMENHPDRGGDEELCKLISAEFESYLRTATAKRKTREGATYHKEHTDAFISRLAMAVKLNCRVEIIGNWIWCFDVSPLDTGTLIFNDFVKSRKHDAWIWHEGDYKKKSKKDFSVNQIRDMWGNDVKRKKQYLNEED